jgi:hypothetical protein
VALGIGRKYLIQVRLDLPTDPGSPPHEVVGQRIAPKAVDLPKALWIVENAFLYEIGDRIEISGSRVAAKSQGLQGDGATAGEAIQYLRWSLWVCLS